MLATSSASNNAGKFRYPVHVCVHAVGSQVGILSGIEREEFVAMHHPRFCVFAWWWLLSVVFTMCSSSLCLPEGVPDAERVEILNAAGESIPIRLMVFNWNAAELLSTIAKLLIEEALGFRAVFDDYRPEANMEVVLGLSGCLDRDCNNMQMSNKHVALDVWLGSAGADVELFMQKHASQAPQDLGSIGYAGGL